MITKRPPCLYLDVAKSVKVTVISRSLGVKHLVKQSDVSQGKPLYSVYDSRRHLTSYF